MARRLPSRRAGPGGAPNTSPGDARVPAAENGAVAEFIADMAAGLARMAGDARLYRVTYFLNLARVEADASRRAAQANAASDRSESTER